MYAGFPNKKTDLGALRSGPSALALKRVARPLAAGSGSKGVVWSALSWLLALASVKYLRLLGFT